MGSEEIIDCYINLTDNLRNHKNLIMKENPELLPSEAAAQTLDEQFIYDDDRACVLAFALVSGHVKWGEKIDWSTIECMLIDDLTQDD